MITQEPTQAQYDAWKATWLQYKDKMQPNRISGGELHRFLQEKYVLTEISNRAAADALRENVTKNAPNAEKLPMGIAPIPRTFFLENAGNGTLFYQAENRDSQEIWGGEISRIFVGIDLVTGFFMVEGSTLLWDVLNALRGLDEKDLQNCVCVTQYLDACKRVRQIGGGLPG